MVEEEKDGETSRQPPRAWIGNYEVGGSGAYKLIPGNDGKPAHLEIGDEYLPVERDQYGATRIGGKEVRRDSSNRIVALVDEQGNEEKVSGDLGAHID